MPQTGLETLSNRIQKLATEGYIQTNRGGDTGIGKTFEDKLGLDEDNHPYPDMDGIELKTKRAESTANTTLFCLAPPIQRRWGKTLLRAVGYRDEKNRLALRTTLSTTPNEQGLAISVSDTHLTVEHESLGVCGKYPLTAIKERMAQKMPSLLFVTAKTRKERGTELFWYHDATFYTGLKPNRFIEEIRDGNACVELRMTTEKNYGTAFRVKSPTVFDYIYTTGRDLADDVSDAPPITIQPPANQRQLTEY